MSSSLPPQIRANALCGGLTTDGETGQGVLLILWSFPMRPCLLDPRPYFADLPDPRRETRNKLHSPHDIVLCAVLSGVEDWVGMEAFAEEKVAWLQGGLGLSLSNGIPSHDTLSEVMGRIDLVAFRAAFTTWATTALPSLAGEPVCIDGKTLRGSREGTNPVVHLVSAFAGQARWVLAQQAVAEKSNEITAIPDLLTLLDLQGAIVSTDAMGCQKAIAQTIVDAGADDVLALKDNHPTLCEDVQLWLDTEVAHGRLPVQETIEKDHGRIEIRRYALSRHLDWLDAKPHWAGLQAVGRVESTRIIGEGVSTECRYFLCSSRINTASPPRSVATGASKTSSIGFRMCNLAKMPVGRGATTPTKTWRSSAAWP